MDFKADRADAKNNREELDLVIRTISAIVFLPKALNKNCDLAQSPGQLFRSSLPVRSSLSLSIGDAKLAEGDA